MIDLHERLSEFSFGYGVTRDTETLLRDAGLEVVPFMPSLVQEKEVGFDVGFNRPGKPLLLQFKLGQSLTRFVRSDKTVPAPVLVRPFWRFAIDTAEPDGQFEALLKAENDGAEVYYVAPRFTDWTHYARHFEDRAVLDNSVIVRPTDIRAALDASGAADGHHRIVYDRYDVHVCSKPVSIDEVDPDAIGMRVAAEIRENGVPLEIVLGRILEGFDGRESIRRNENHADDYKASLAGDDAGGRSPSVYTRRQRSLRFDDLLQRSRSRAEAVAAAVGIELWMLGIQLVMAVEK